MSIFVYEYKKCSTCQKAVKLLESLDVKFERIPIIEQPPSEKELKKMLGFIKKRGGSFKNLFNTSGEHYRELKIGDKIKAGLSEEDALKLLASNGRLIKRPFLLTENEGLVGFKEEEWRRLIG